MGPHSPTHTRGDGDGKAELDEEFSDDREVGLAQTPGGLGSTERRAREGRVIASEGAHFDPKTHVTESE